MKTLDDSEVRKNGITKSAQTTADSLSGGRLEQNPYFVPRLGLVVEGRKTPREFFSPQLYKIQGFDSIGVPLDVVLLTAPLGLMLL